jgi:type IV pilus assembly protein PilQ
VLGGVYEHENRKTVHRVPFLGELPLVDWMFKNTLRTNNKAELLIFVTPKIVKEDLRI